MARVVSLTLFLLSWLLLFSYAASDSAPSKECRHVCTEKVVKAFNHTDVADFVSNIRPQIDKLANLVCYHLYPDVCPVETTSTKGNKRKFHQTDGRQPLYTDVCPVETSTKLFCKLLDGIPGQPLVPKPSNDAEMVNMDSKQKTKGNKRKFPDTDDQDPGACSVKTPRRKVRIKTYTHTDVSYDARLVKTPSTKEKEDSKEKGNIKTL